MNIHNLKHLLSETLLLGVLVFPFAIALAALLGLASWIMGGHAVGLRASWVTWCATMGIAPLVLRISCGPDTRVICDRCTTLRASRLKRRCGEVVQKEQRRHPRYQVKFPATFSNDHISGFGMIGDLSAGGCRVRSKLTVAPGDFGKLFINLPGCHAPLKVSRALVRWAMGNECGLEFIHMDPDERGLLHRITGKMGIDAIGEVKQVLG